MCVCVRERERERGELSDWFQNLISVFIMNAIPNTTMLFNKQFAFVLIVLCTHTYTCMDIDCPRPLNTKYKHFSDGESFPQLLLALGKGPRTFGLTNLA